MCTNRDNTTCCCLFTIVGSLLAAAGIAAVFFAGLITAVAALLYITLILGLAGVLYLEISYYCSDRRFCSCPIDVCLIASSVGAIITSIFALTIATLASGSIPAAILVGAVAFFLIATIINILVRLFQTFCYKQI